MKALIKSLCLMMLIPMLFGGRIFQPAYAQSQASSLPDLKFTHLSLEDGLPHASVYGIVQDEQGFMWFATTGGGLVRYDGYNMKVYTHNDLDKASLSNDRVWTLFIDQSGTLWAGTIDGGLNRYNHETDNFTSFRADPDDPTTLPFNDFKVMYQTADGRYWVGTTDGFSRFEPETGTFFTYRNDPENPQSLSHNDVRDILEDPETGLLWLAMRRAGVSIFDPVTETFTNYRNDPNNPTSISNDAVNVLLKDRAGNIWLGTSSGLDRFDRQTNTFIHHTNNSDDPTSLGGNAVLSMLEDSQGRFWVGHNNGVDLFDPQTETFTRYQNNPNNPDSLSATAVRVIYEDQAGSIWIGTNGGGVNYLTNLPEKFANIQNDPDDSHSLGSNNVQSLHISRRGELWVGTNDGLEHFTGQSFTHYLHNSDEQNSVSDGAIWSIAEDAQGNLWVGAENGAFDYFDVKAQTFTHYHHNPNDPGVTNTGLITRLLVDKNNTLWLHAEGYGLERFDGKTFTIYQPHAENPSPTQIPGLYIADMVTDLQDDLIWLAMREGLVKMDIKTETFTTYPLHPDVPDQNRIWSLLQTKDGLLWIASPTGLYRFDPASETFTQHYTVDNGLPSNNVTKIVEDGTGSLWLTTETNGLSRFDPALETFRNYDKLDGLPDNQFRRLIVQAPDGRIFAGGPSGLTAFYPAQVTDNPNPPPVVLTGFELFNSPVKVGGEDGLLSQPINLTDELVLNYEQSVFTFEFSALNYTVPKKNQFAYKMEGFDNDWRTTTSDRRFATYTNLDPGSYTFRVKASNNDGVWNEEGVSLKVTITPPWWETAWFRTLATLLVVGAIVGAFVGQRVSAQRRQRILETLVAARTNELNQANKELDDFAHVVSHDLKAPLRGVSQLSTWLLEDYADQSLDDAGKDMLTKLHGRTQHMHQMIDDILAYSKLGRVKGQISTVDLNPLVNNIIDLLDPPAHIQITVAGQLPTVQGDAVRLGQVFQNLLSNAIKYMDKPQGQITVACEDGGLLWRFRVADNGQGIEEKYFEKIFQIFQTLNPSEGTDSTGVGLTVVKKIVETAGGKIWVESVAGQGSTFYFTLPKAGQS